MRQYFWRNCFNLRFKIDVVVMIIWIIVIIINSVLTLQVSTASLPHYRKPCKIKVVSNHTCSRQSWVCAGSRRERVRLNGFRRQGISSTPGGFLKCPIPFRVCGVCAEQYDCVIHVNSTMPFSRNSQMAWEEKRKGLWHKNTTAPGRKKHNNFGRKNLIVLVGKRNSYSGKNIVV